MRLTKYFPVWAMHIFEEWYAKEIASLFANAVEVYSGWHSHGISYSVTDAWSTTYWPVQNATHKALLINIHPIKEETAEDLLRELVDYCTKPVKDAEEVVERDFDVILERAKRYLDQKKQDT